MPERKVISSASLAGPARCLTALVTALLTGVALADTITLENGSTLEGTARRDGKQVVLETRHGTMRFPAAEVRSITEGKTTWEEYLERRDALLNRIELLERDAQPSPPRAPQTEEPALPPVPAEKQAVERPVLEKQAAETRPAPQQAAPSATPADLHVALGDWCKRRRLKSEARRHFTTAAELEPDHEPAHARLGHIHYDGEWLTGDEYRQARGFVKVDGEWVARAQARRDAAEKDRRVALRKHQRVIRAAVTKMSSKKRAVRSRGRLDLVEYAESTGDLNLAAFAGRVAKHYNAQWAAIKRSLSAKVLTTVRATHAQLKRPIPTFTTSLGANSTPVTIQLPELQVARIETTVLLPADIELDDE